ncbi:uncharacterized protein LOC34620997 [Cyclospora cayetanensis]|uniref:Uncharacterized protein LOC34620997 n=1 Tax=Cyclospora cayetanensis TaxID=88456 RepID=A0A6P6S0S9_9EIME|nr:uncharacterized protein LOC34620997 [Cyclospora cayetanensis]
MAAKALFTGILKPGLEVRSGGSIDAAIACSSAATGGTRPCYNINQRRKLSIWKSLNPWNVQKDSGSAAGDAAQQEPPQQRPVPPGVATLDTASQSAAATPLKGAVDNEEAKRAVIASRLLEGFQRDSKRIQTVRSPPSEGSSRLSPGTGNLCGAATSPCASSEASKLSCRRGGSRWQNSREAWLPLSAPELRQELQQIFSGSRERREEPRRREETPVCRASRKPLGSLLTRLSRSPIFLHAARQVPAAPAGAASPTPAAKSTAEMERALFSQMLDFYFTGPLDTVLGVPQRLLAAGGPRVMHPSRTRGAPDGKPPDLTEDQFFVFALVSPFREIGGSARDPRISFYANMLRSQIPRGRSPAISGCPPGRMQGSSEAPYVARTSVERPL